MKRLLSALALVGATAVHASVTLYTDESAYLAAVGARGIHLDFAGSPGTEVSGSSFSQAVAFGSCTDAADVDSCATVVLHTNDAITDRGGSRASPVESFAWRFNLSDVFAFAFHYFGGGIDAVNLVDVGLHIDAIDTTSASGFIGLVSDRAFYGGIAVNAVTPGGGKERDFIDDFHISRQAQVPEPATLCLGILAMVVSAWARRTRATAAKPA